MVLGVSCCPAYGESVRVLDLRNNWENNPGMNSSLQPTAEAQVLEPSGH